MLGRELDNRRICVIALIALLVSSGVIFSSSASGVSPTFARSSTILPPPFLSSAVKMNLAKVTEPNIATQPNGPIVFKSADAGFGFFGSQSVTETVTAHAIEVAGPVPFPPEGAATATGSVGGSSGSQSGGLMFLQVRGSISASGEVVSAVSLPSGQVLIVSGSNQIGLAQLVQPGQIVFKTSIGMNEIGSGPQLSYSSMSIVTAAIPGLWLDSSKRRTRSQIYIEILELMKRGPMTPFEIAFYARLNHKRTKEYVEFLKRSGYLENREEDGKLIYVLTKNGLGFLERIKSIFEESQIQAPTIDQEFVFR